MDMARTSPPTPSPCRPPGRGGAVVGWPAGGRTSAGRRSRATTGSRALVFPRTPSTPSISPSPSPSPKAGVPKESGTPLVPVPEPTLTLAGGGVLSDAGPLTTRQRLEHDGRIPLHSWPYSTVMSPTAGSTGLAGECEGALMATDMPADTAAADERWQRMWSHRKQLLKVARRRSMSPEDAEDAVHEAILRAAERPDLDDERLGAWLTTVTMRLCVDRHRQVNREAEVGSRPSLLAPDTVPVEEAVCDRAEAKWLAVRSGELPARQAEALRLRSEDLDVSQVAVRMGLSYRTVESLLARARRTLRASLAGTLGLMLFLVGRGRLRGAAMHRRSRSPQRRRP
ncbi:ECF RNA polymerase sigma factor SigM [Streptomyces sp. MBT84]|nr:ECF RNA polymerase sigma factor SigM [Streptomyces sp. MBT84]